MASDKDHRSSGAQQLLWAYSEHDENLLKTGKFSDAQVVCGNQTWNIHKAIICTRSVYFEKALTGNFEEAKTGTIVIQEQDPAKVGWVLTCIYTGKATPDLAKLLEDNATMIPACLEALKVADYFCFDGFQNLISQWLEERFFEEVRKFQASCAVLDSAPSDRCQYAISGFSYRTCAQNGITIATQQCSYCQATSTQRQNKIEVFTVGFIDDFLTIAESVYARGKPSTRLHKVFMDFFVLTRYTLFNSKEIGDRINNIPFLAASLCSAIMAEQLSDLRTARKSPAVRTQIYESIPAQCHKCKRATEDTQDSNKKLSYKELWFSEPGRIAGYCENCV
ncbi:hypothetical protein F5Y16DRAFT_418420 [Xylariaceae sp. FL0255]|nr:hypothetical protein F5Y16DRAFT_418420 [Xylariaceae sp. FL0255]